MISFLHLLNQIRQMRRNPLLQISKQSLVNIKNPKALKPSSCPVNTNNFWIGFYGCVLDKIDRSIYASHKYLTVNGDTMCLLSFQ